MPLTDHSRVLVPIDVSTAETPLGGLRELLDAVEVVLLGYFPVPDQAVPAQLRENCGDEASERLGTIADQLTALGGEVTTHLVFTHDHRDPIDRIAEEESCDAVLIPGRDGSIDRLLVPLRGEANLDRILSLVRDLATGCDASVTLFHSVEEDGDRDQGEALLAEATERLVGAGVDRDSIEQRLSSDGATETEIIDLAAEFDLLVLGETEPSLRERIFGDVPHRIAEETDTPTFVVRDTS